MLNTPICEQDLPIHCRCYVRFPCTQQTMITCANTIIQRISTGGQDVKCDSPAFLEAHGVFKEAILPELKMNAVDTCIYENIIKLFFHISPEP
jgi:hypothetical protein